MKTIETLPINIYFRMEAPDLNLKTRWKNRKVNIRRMGISAGYRIKLSII
jgi:hypothetical protein